MSRISKLLSKSSNPVKFVQPKMFVPVDCQIPETPKTIMARTMLQSGIITRDEYEKMLGVEFDSRSESDENFDDDDFEDFEDDFKTSAFAEYEEYLNVEEKEKEPEAQPQSVAQPDPSVEQSENADGTASE